jgi:hypothetical protein
MNPYSTQAWLVCYDNDNSAFIPEIWAMEGLRILEENMVAASLVHRDFQNEIAQFGDVVNTRRPGDFKIKRKTDTDEVDAQDANSTNVQVPLDQHFYTTFVIKDGEASKSMQELTSTYLVPGMITIARGVDRAVVGRVHEFYGTPRTRVGRLGGLSQSNAKDFVLEARKVLNDKKCPPEARALLLASSAETAILQAELFIAAQQRGDGGNALENATLGRILGFNSYMAQNVGDIATGTSDVATGTLTDPYSAGTTGSMNSQITGYAAVVGEFITVAGNDQPTYITARTASSDTTAVTLNEASKYDTLDNAVATVYKSCAVNNASGYAAGWSKPIAMDGFTLSPQVGQLLAFGTGGSRRTYTIIEVDGSTFLLDRPLEVALVDDQKAFPGPAGSYNLAFHRESLALVTRPLALPNQSLGVLAATVDHNAVGMRVCMQYDGKAQGTRVTMDVLAGVAKLDTNLACLFLG